MSRVPCLHRTPPPSPTPPTCISFRPCSSAEMLDQVDVFIFDCDGVIWKGDTVRLSIALLARAAERVCVCCNCVCCVCVCL
jgi:hypothetical protein